MMLVSYLSFEIDSSKSHQMFNPRCVWSSICLSPSICQEIIPITSSPHSPQAHTMVVVVFFFLTGEVNSGWLSVAVPVPVIAAGVGAAVLLFLGMKRSVFLCIYAS